MPETVQSWLCLELTSKIDKKSKLSVLPPKSQRHVRLDIRFFSYGSVLSTYMLILIGGFVSASGSGLAWPDWPTFHGPVLPILSGPVLVEVSPTLSALGVTLFVTATLLIAWRAYRESR